MLPSKHQFGSSSHRVEVENITLKEEILGYRDTENVEPTIVKSELDAPATMRVCRICLAMNVKMYHVSEYDLSKMYGQVIGDQINTEDNLPQMLCWECVARLSTANNFIEKALKTQWILLNKISSGRFLTIRDITTIDKTQNKLKSSLGHRHYNDEYTVHVIEETVDRNKKMEEEVETKVDIEICFNKEGIKDYLGDDSGFRNVKEEAIEESDDESNGTADEELVIQSSKVFDDNEIIKVTPTLTKSKRRKPLPCCKELIVLLEDFSLSKYNTHTDYRELIAKSMEPESENKEATLNITDTGNTQSETIPRKIKNLSNEETASDLTCNICYKQFTENSSLAAHVKNHPIMFLCPFCNYRTWRKGDINKHSNALHTKKKVFNCLFCNYKTFEKWHLTLHTNAQHTKQRSYKCSRCSFTAYHRSTVNQHIKKHIQKANLNCPHCNYMTTQKSHLKQHINSKHTKEIVYDCPHCNFVTYRRSAQMRHIHGQHNKKKVFDCPYCLYNTCNKYDIKKHLDAKHSEKNIDYRQIKARLI